MFYAILLAVFIVCFIIGFIMLKFRNNLIGMYVATVLIIIIIIANLCGQYKSITSPDYKDVLIEEIAIPEIDTNKSKTVKHDVVYVDTEKEIIYINNKTYEECKVELVEKSETPKVGIYNCIPDNNFNSVDLGFNRTVKYIIYVPKDFEVYAAMKLK